MTDTKPGAGVAGKEVLYIDVDDEITGVIDKMRASKQKIVALVLPKRATVFQSIVNMKLLKRAADTEKKNIVLITSESGLLPLASTVGLHVAKTLQSRPEIPEGPLGGEDKSDEIEEISADGDSNESSSRGSTRNPSKNEEKLDKSRTVGELAGAAALDDQLDETIDLGDEDDAPAGAAPAAAAVGAAAKPKKGKDKKLKVPNFKKFRVLMVAVILILVTLIFGIVFAMKSLAKASINIQTDSSAINSSTVITASPASGTTLDTSTDTLAATSVQTQKTASAQVDTTGQQNEGATATGAVTMSAQYCNGAQPPSSGFPPDVPAGVGISTTVNGTTLTFITQADTSFSQVGTYKNHCIMFAANNPTSVTAQQGGSQYNVQPTTFSVSARSEVSATSSNAMTGGTDNIVKIATASDISSAEQKLTSADTTSIKQQLQSELQQKGLYALTSSFNPGTPSVSTNVQAGAAASSVTATSTTTYSMIGVAESDLDSIIKSDIQSKTSLANQQILDYGLSGAVWGLQSQNSDGGATLTLQTTVIVGSALNTTAIKQQVEGMKSGDAQSAIKQYPGVTNVTVSYSPFWVNSIPKNPSKITIHIQKPTASSSSSNASSSQ